MKTNVGKNIRIERQKKSLSQENLAESIGMSSGNLGKIERGEIAINIDTLSRVAKILDVPVSVLLKDNQASEPSPDYSLISSSDFARLHDNLKELKKEFELLKNSFIELREEVNAKKQAQ